jgi:hypothetical protein
MREFFWSELLWLNEPVSGYILNNPNVREELLDAATYFARAWQKLMWFFLKKQRPKMFMPVCF